MKKNYDELINEFKNIVGTNNFSAQFSKYFVYYKK